MEVHLLESKTTGLAQAASGRIQRKFDYETDYFHVHVTKLNAAAVVFIEILLLPLLWFSIQNHIQAAQFLQRFLQRFLFMLQNTVAMA